MALKKNPPPPKEPRPTLNLRVVNGRLVIVGDILERVQVAIEFIEGFGKPAFTPGRLTFYTEGGDPVVYVLESTVELGRTWWFRRLHRFTDLPPLVTP